MNAPYSWQPVALIVNEHPGIRRALRERIQASFANFQLREAAMVEDALWLLDQEPIDIVVIDGEARGINGLKGTRAILDRSPATSVILLSSFNEPACRSAATRAGAMAFVSKRAVGSELMQVLDAFAARHAPRD